MFANEAFRKEWQPRLLSVLRIVVALLFLQHGMTKLFNFPGTEPAGFRWFTLAPGLAGLIEFFGSLALLFGFYTRLAAFVMSGEMAVAYWIAHVPNGLSKAGAMGLFPYNNGGEPAIIYCFVFLYLAVAGGGPWGVDHRPHPA
jgi:putative oxidoreductase